MKPTMESVAPEFSSVSSLGGLKKIYRNNSRFFFVLYILAAPLALAVLAGAIVERFTRPASEAAILGATSIGMLALAIGVWRYHRNSRRSVGLFEDGIAIRDRNAIQFITWHEISSVRAFRHPLTNNEQVVGWEHLYTLQMASGEVIRVDDWVVDVKELGDAIAAAVAREQNSNAVKIGTSGSSSTQDGLEGTRNLASDP